MTNQTGTLKDIIVSFVSRPLLTGLITVIPILLTGYIIYWTLSSLEAMIKGPLLWILPDVFYIPGLGLFAAVITLYLIGLFMEAWMVSRIFEWFEQRFIRLPLVRDIYEPIKSFFNYFSPRQKQKFKSVVEVTIPETGLVLIGLQTRDAEDLPEEVQLEKENYTLVYFPMALNVGGYSAFVPKEYVKPLDWSVKKATSYVMSAGVVS